MKKETHWLVEAVNAKLKEKDQKIDSIIEWIETQINYVPDYLEALEHTEDPALSLQRIMRNNLKIYKKRKELL